MVVTRGDKQLLRCLLRRRPRERFDAVLAAGAVGRTLEVG